MPKIFQGYAKDMPMICQKYAKDILKICQHLNLQVDLTLWMNFREYSRIKKGKMNDKVKWGGKWDM